MILEEVNAPLCNEKKSDDELKLARRDRVLQMKRGIKFVKGGEWEGKNANLYTPVSYNSLTYLVNIQCYHYHRNGTDTEIALSVITLI